MKHYVWYFGDVAHANGVSKKKERNKAKKEIEKQLPEGEL